MNTLKKIAHFFVCHRGYVVGEYKGQGHIENKTTEHIDWRNTIFVYCAIAVVILIAVFLIHPGPETTGWFGTHRTP